MKWSEVILFWSEVKWSEMKWVRLKFLGTKVPWKLRWPFTEGTWLYCDYFIWCVSFSVVVSTCFVMCGCVYTYVGVFWQLCGCFGNMCTCIYCVFVLFVLCLCIVSFMYIYSYLFCLSALNRHTVRPFTESDDTRGCNNTICPPEDEQGTARNMLKIIM